MRNTKDLIDKSRVILMQLKDKLDNKEQLNEEELYYFKFLLTNKFMDNKGNFTNEGKNSLFN